VWERVSEREREKSVIREEMMVRVSHNYKFMCLWGPAETKVHLQLAIKKPEGLFMIKVNKSMKTRLQVNTRPNNKRLLWSMRAPD